MSYFKILSDDPADFPVNESEGSSSFSSSSSSSSSSLDDVQSFDLAYSEIEDCIELILDTGEQFTVPLIFIIEQCRKLSALHKSLIH